MEIVFIGFILLFIAEYNNKFSSNKFIRDNEIYFRVLKEDDYEFLLRAKYGDNVDVDKVYSQRVKVGLITIVALIFLFLSNLTFINIILSFVVGFFVFKNSYFGLKKYYKRHIHKINLMLPYFLKNMEILAQHYTIPVALSRSIETAPDIFKEGLRELIAKINEGDSSIEPYMEFARKYPVGDSIRMMRLLYRLGLGSQENKHEQLIMFSRSVSTLQNKARETKYKERLSSMENRTMFMLGVTGGGVMVLLVLSIVNRMSF